MGRIVYKVCAKVWLYPGPAAWHFISLPKKESVILKKIFGPAARGFGSLPVLVSIGKTSWRTSIFPDNKRGCYLLPLKAQVRKQEKIAVGDAINLLVEIMI